jgi:four helix bundle protein
MNSEQFGYKKLRIWQDARDLTISIHQMTLKHIPKFEMYEEGSQIRRSIKSVKSNIVEGFGRRRHKAEYIRFLDFSYASALETLDHLETLHETESLTNTELFSSLSEQLTHLSRSIFQFTKGVNLYHNEDRA